MRYIVVFEWTDFDMELCNQNERINLTKFSQEIHCLLEIEMAYNHLVRPYVAVSYGVIYVFYVIQKWSKASQHLWTQGEKCGRVDSIDLLF